MNTKEAKAHLIKVLIGTRIEKTGKLWTVIQFDGDEYEYTGRELIKFAKVFTSDNPENTSEKSSWKHSGRTRAHVRDCIKKGEYDKIQSHQTVRKDNPARHF
jgi:hypothetical protein